MYLLGNWVQERVSRLERVNNMEADSPCADDTSHHAVVERRQYVLTEKQFQSSESHVVCRLLEDCPVRQVEMCQWRSSSSPVKVMLSTGCLSIVL
jgi:hypothetical protein